MAKGTRIGKVCGKEYEQCKTWLSTDKFRYQDVACSPQCGAKYFAEIEASRAKESIDKPEKKQPKKMVAESQVKEKEVKVTKNESVITDDKQ